MSTKAATLMKPVMWTRKAGAAEDELPEVPVDDGPEEPDLDPEELPDLDPEEPVGDAEAPEL